MLASNRDAVLDAIARGAIPAGRPSELAVYGLTEDAPASYWERWCADAVARICERTPPASPEPPEVDEEPPERQREPRPVSADGQIAFARTCAFCGRPRERGEYFGGAYRDDGERVASCFECYLVGCTLEQLSARELLALAGPGAVLIGPGRDCDPGPEPLGQVVEIVRCCLQAWQRLAPSEFCSWRPIRNGLARFGLDNPELIDRACERLGVERRRCGAGERWRLRSERSNVEATP